MKMPGDRGQRHPSPVRTAAPRATAQGFDLASHLPHLLRRAHFEAEARFAELYGTQATSRQLALLVTVAQSPGATQAEVARLIGLDGNTCSDLVRRACHRGWLQRQRSAADGRAFRLTLLPAGRTLVSNSAVPLAAPYATLVAERLTVAERRRLTALLRKLLGLHGQTESDAPD